MQTYVCANADYGVFQFKNIPGNIVANIIAQPYHTNKTGQVGNSVEGQGLERLGYQQGKIIRGNNSVQNYQPINKYQGYVITINWVERNNEVKGMWTVFKILNNNIKAIKIINPDTSFTAHAGWWKNFWSKSSITIPNKQIEKQYYLKLYKLGCIVRKGAPAITLQAIRTADKGNLPPWKGDFHNDLNTQLSYWPAYTSNHLQEAKTFTDWLWKTKNTPKNIST